MFKSDKLPKILLELFKGDDQKNLCDISLIEYLNKGIKHPLIGGLVEAFITQSIDSTELVLVPSY